MKKSLLFVCSLLVSMNMCAADFESASQAVKNMGVGWNLGNTLEANRQNIDNVLITDFTRDDFWGRQGLESETCWGQGFTKPELIKMMKEAGFGAIRVPVTWYNHMDKDGKVSAEWMKRVHEVVDYVIDQGLYCIINVHHDTGADSDGFHSWIKADEDNYNTNKVKYENLWKQIATEFKDYDQHLLFESYNEMLDKLSSWCFASFASKNKYDAAVAASAYKAINGYAQSFVDVVRATGGNNAERNLVVNTYAACCGSGTWNQHLKDPLSELTIPTDQTEGHLMVQVHDYPNIEGGIDKVKEEIDEMVAAWNTHIISKGVPMILGEWGSANVDKGDGKTDYDVRRDVMFQFVDYMVQKCKENSVATFYWMGLTDGIYRSLPAFNQPDLAERIVKAYHGSDYQGKYPTKDDFDIQCFNVNWNQQWSEIFLYGNNNTRNAFKVSEYKGVRVELAEIPAAGSLKVKVYGDASGDKFKEGTYDLASDSKVTTVNFVPAKTGANVSRITLQCYVASAKAKIVKMALVKNDDTEEPLWPAVAWGGLITADGTLKPTAIQSVKIVERQTDDAIHLLSGQRVTAPRKGIYIQNGKKYLTK